MVAKYTTWNFAKYFTRGHAILFLRFQKKIEILDMICSEYIIVEKNSQSDYDECTIDKCYV